MNIKELNEALKRVIKEEASAYYNKIQKCKDKYKNLSTEELYSKLMKKENKEYKKGDKIKLNRNEIIAQLAKSNKPLKENIEAGDVFEMTLEFISKESDGSKKYELDGVVFYQVEGEDLDNAIEVCIDEEFMPDWENEGIDGYVIESIDYEPGEDSGIVTISVY